MQFIDKPMAVAKPLLISEITDAISAYEPRAEVVNVTFEIDDNAPGKLIPIVEIEVNTNE
jgi:phage baseplate assembly protein W